jgi:phosphotransferase system HPr-like phosphotransfer protein
MSIKFDQYTNTLSVVDDSVTNADMNLIPEGTGSVVASGSFVSSGNITYIGGAIGSDVLRVYKNNTIAGGTSTEASPAFSFIPKQSNFGASVVGLGENPRINTTGGDGFYFTTLASLGYSGVTQLKVSHTASAVNYVQVTGAATGNRAAISAQGSDTNVGINYLAKGSGLHVFAGQNGSVQFVVNPAASAVNYWQGTGSATNIAPSLAVVGSDTNISQVFQSKGTGAIDLAAGSRGVNISNGGTVTAITRTAAGSAYTSQPTVAISAPTTAGGVQATATVTIVLAAVSSIASGGTGYTAGNVLTISGGTSAQTAQLTVSTVSAGVITAVTVSRGGDYTVAPSNPASVTGGTGTGATFNLTFGILAFTITNAGSGYVEQPTVTFSGGGGSGAAAYATVGSDTTIRSIGTNLIFSHPNGAGLQIKDNGQTACYPLFQSSGTTIQAYASSSGSNVGYQWVTKGVSGHSFATNNSVGNQQLNVSHTASAVNYVQVTGAATGSAVQISAQGSDAGIAMQYRSKSNTGQHIFTADSANAFRVLPVSSAVNYPTVSSSIASAAPIFGVAGTDTNIDLALTPKGTGNVRFGTYTADMTLVVQGYITIKDSGGTVRKLAVIA